MSLSDTDLLLWALHWLPLVALDLLQLIKLGSDVVDGELKEVPESSQVLRCGSGHGAGVLVGWGVTKRKGIGTGKTPYVLYIPKLQSI